MKHEKMMCGSSSKEDLSLRLRGESKVNLPCPGGGDSRRPRDVQTPKVTLGRTDRLSGVLSLPLTVSAPAPMWDGFHFSEFPVGMG